MSGPVDVLAVMDRAAGSLFAAQGEMPDDLMQARAAVAELVDKATAILSHNPAHCDTTEEAALRAALAACGAAA